MKRCTWAVYLAYVLKNMLNSVPTIPKEFTKGVLSSRGTVLWIRIMTRRSSTTGHSPVTMEASRVADMIGCAPGNSLEIADAEQAYIQADMQGTETWVCLPPEARPDWWKDSWPNLRRPVCRLKKALYGHPRAGDGKRCLTHTSRVLVFSQSASVTLVITTLISRSSRFCMWTTLN